MTSRKLLQDLKAGFREPKTERRDRPTTNIPFLHQGNIHGKNCFCMLLSRRHGAKERPWYELASLQEYIDRDITRTRLLLNNFFHSPKILVGDKNYQSSMVCFVGTYSPKQRQPAQQNSKDPLHVLVWGQTVACKVLLGIWGQQPKIPKPLACPGLRSDRGMQPCVPKSTSKIYGFRIFPEI